MTNVDWIDAAIGVATAALGTILIVRRHPIARRMSAYPGGRPSAPLGAVVTGAAFAAVGAEFIIGALLHS